MNHPTRWTGLVEAHEAGGFIAYGDYLELRKLALLAMAAIAAFRLDEDCILSGTSKHLVLRVPLETIQLQASAFEALRKELE